MIVHGVTGYRQGCRCPTCTVSKKKSSYLYWNRTMNTPWQKHVGQWGACTKCPLCRTRKNVVLARGSLPCDVLFIGEAPGESEDVLGRPFVGPAGKLLDDIIDASVPTGVSFAFTNLVACVPRDEENGGKTAEPTKESIEECQPRLDQLVKMAEPKLAVCVGRLAETWLAPGYKYSPKSLKNVPQIAVVHPAAILRANVAMQGLMIKRCVVAISNAVRELTTSA